MLGLTPPPVSISVASNASHNDTVPARYSRLRDRAPESILWRRDKVGFEAPDATMTAVLLGERSERLLASSFLREFLDAEVMRLLINRVRDGTCTQEESRVVWRWLVLESWQRQFSSTKQGSGSQTFFSGDLA